MKLSLKKLPENKSISLELAEDATCSDLKALIQQLEECEVSWQKVIFAGRIVPDEALLSAHGVQDGASLVLVVRKPDASGPTPAPAPAPAAAPAAATPSTPAAPVPAAATTTDTPAAPVVDATIADVTTARRTSLSSFTPSEESLVMLLGMGFEREQAVRALRLARNDVQNACELLISGSPLPEVTLPAAPAAAGAGVTRRGSISGTPAVAASGGAAAAAGTAEATPTDPQREAANLMTDLIQRMGQQGSDPQSQFEWVVQQPQFQRIRSLLQTRPDLFSALLTQLGGTNPQLHELISQNQTEFLEWLNDDSGEELFSSGGGGGGGGGAVAGGGGGGGMPQLSAADEAALTELIELGGFSREAARQAYLACGKNKEMAANYLFENS